MQVRVSPEISSILDDGTSVSIRRGKTYVGVDHLFEALIANANLLPKSIARGHMESLRRIDKFVQAQAWPGASPSVEGDIFYTPRCAALINEASRLAERLHSPQASAGHLLLAILADAHCAPSRAFDSLKMSREGILNELRAALADGNLPAQPTPADRPATTPEKAAAGTVAPGSVEDFQPQEKKVDPLDALTRDLTKMAREGKIDAVIGRESEVMQMLEICARQGKHNVILVGEAGTGKTKIVEGLAWSIVHKGLATALGLRRIVELNISALLSGTQYRGAFEEKVMGLIKELQGQTDTLLFIDEIHLIMGAGSTDGESVDFANLLKPALARGELKVVGATTLKEYRKFIAKDPALERRFQMVRVEELDPDATLRVLKNITPSLEKHHGVKIENAALKAAISLTQRYLPNRNQPDKAIDAIDQACAGHRIKAMMSQTVAPGRSTRSRNGGTKVVTPYDVRKVVSQAAALPLEALSAEERVLLTDLAPRLRARIIGQHEAIGKVVSAIKKSKAGLADPNRPDSVMLFLGPTGVGKTQLAKELAREVFGSSSHLVVFDMSQYVEAHAVSRLIGAPPGYVGSDQEGLLTSAVSNTPYCILLFDEIEKAHPQIFDIFLPILDEGRLKDSDGRLISFKNCIIIFTSNVGAEKLSSEMGEDSTPDVIDELRGHFRPEFINRLDEIVPFYPLLAEDVRSVLKIMVDEIRKRLLEKSIGIRMYQRAYEFLGEKGYSREFGARELKRCVERLIANPISERIIDGRVKDGDMIDVLHEDGQLVFRKGRPHSKSRVQTP